MNFIEPHVECWHNTDNVAHVAKCARVCYKSESDKDPSILYSKLKTNGHNSMYRHATYYWIIPRKCLFGHFSEFVSVAYDKNNWYISANGQWVLNNNKKLVSKFDACGRRVSEDDLKGTAGECCIRRTFVIDTQISTTRELNRVSPNNIAEQSTRYVNFGKKGGVKIARPHWYNHTKWFARVVAHLAFSMSAFFYNVLLKLGLPPQDAREVLCLSTWSRAAYTYSLSEWQAILQLRYHGTTGKPHPNAKYIATQIKRILDEEGFSKFTGKL